MTRVPDQLVHLLKRTFIEQQIDPLARRQFALFVLSLGVLLAASGFGISMTAAHFGKSVRGHTRLQ